MRLEGRVLLGLDEFMLRLGHLTVLCEAAVDAGGSAQRFSRETIKRLTRLVPVSGDVMHSVARYLRTKKLCPEDSGPKVDPKDFRYPELIVRKSGDEYVVESISSENAVEIEWQDFCLAADGVRSRVGAITVHGKRGSKTGLSHILDWAMMLDLANAAGNLSGYGQLISKSETPFKPPNLNPYILGNERLLFAELVISNDFDVFAALVSMLFPREGPFRKKDATQLYVDTVREIANAAEGSRHLSHRQRQLLFSLWRDVRRNNRSDEIIPSTAWHRASSRFETYVDLGLLMKGLVSEDERYAYKYYISDTLRTAYHTLQTAPDAEHWISEHLADVILGVQCSRQPIDVGDLIELLPAVIAPMARPTSPLPISALTSGLVWLRADMGLPVTFGAARQSLEQLAIRRPDVARLSTGSTTRAEYISMKLGRTPDVRSSGSATV